jgi:hypothetical protein
VFSDPLGGLFFGGETFDYFRLAIGPGIFSRHENGPIFGHPANVRLRRCRSSQSSCHNQTDPLPGTVRHLFRLTAEIFDP